jgi:hypothetical protein
MAGAIGASATITDDNLLLYYKFDSANFNGNSLQSLAVSSSGLGRGPSVTFKQLSFNYVLWDDSTSYSSPSMISTLA